jgi:hypothetical protein
MARRFPLRHIASIVGLVFLVSLTGCSSTRWGFVKNNDRQAAPVASGEVPTASQLVEYLNDNAGRIQSLRVDDMSLTLYQGIRAFNLSAKMITDKPRNFRLSAGTLGNQVVDLGSNEQEFWYWISKANPPYQVYCSYKDLKEGRVSQMPFPFQPEWVMESLGLGPYGPPEKYQVESDRETVKLVEKTTSPEGKAVRKVIVFKRARVSPPNAQVTDYLLLDDVSSKEVCAAHVREAQLDTRTNAVVPKRLELRWPDEKLRVDMHMGVTTVNTQVLPQMFTRQVNPNIQSFNLAQMRIDNTPPPQAYSGLDPKVRPAQALVP